ncbi:unnamed protein product, partial [Ectocarpus sp. 12 AP-2014]
VAVGHALLPDPCVPNVSVCCQSSCFAKTGFFKTHTHDHEVRRSTPRLPSRLGAGLLHPRPRPPGLEQPALQLPRPDGGGRAEGSPQRPPRDPCGLPRGHREEAHRRREGKGGAQEGPGPGPGPGPGARAQGQGQGQGGCDVQ